MTPQDFITKWGPGGPAYALNEEQGAQSHFIDRCDLLSVPKPGSEPGHKFEEKSALIGGRTGYADMPDEEILKRLLALNLERSAA